MLKTQDDTEIMDLVDANDQVIGQIEREQIYDIKEGRLDGFVRAAGCFLVNGAGQIWVPRRTLQKKIAPGGLDFSADEHVQAGEDYQQAIIRGLAEEVAIEADPAKLTLLGKIGPTQSLPYFHAVFTYPVEETPPLGEDYMSSEWMDPAELLQLLEGDDSAKGHLLQGAMLLPK